MPTILMIEGDRLIVEPVERALHSMGYTVLTAHEGATGLARPLNHKPDLVI